MIRQSLLVATLLFLFLILIQVLRVPGVAGEAFVGGVLLVLGTTLYWIREKEVLERGEMLTIWGCVLLFLVYALLKLGGVL